MPPKKSELAVQAPPNAITKQAILDYLIAQKVRDGVPPEQVDLAINIALSFNLNPFKREVHFTKYGEKITVVVGYEVYLKRAEATMKLDGWDVDVAGTGTQMKATITIYRKDWSRPFKHTVIYAEAVQTDSGGRPNKTWAKMPAFMLKKVAIGQGFRLAFPEELGGMPYLPEEVGKEEEVKVSAPPATDEQKKLVMFLVEMGKISEEWMKVIDGPKFTSERAEKILEKHKHVFEAMDAQESDIDVDQISNELEAQGV